MPSRGQKFNIIIVKSEMVLDFHHDFRLFGFFFSMHIVFLMWGKISGRSQTMSVGGPEKLFYVCRVCIQGTIDLFRNFVAPLKFSTSGTRPEKSIAYNLQYVSWKSFWKVKWNTTLGRTSGKFPGRTKHPQLGTRLLGWGGGGRGGEGREKTGTKRINIGEQSDPSGCLESAYFARQFFFPFSPNAEPGPRLKHPKR